MLFSSAKAALSAASEAMVAAEAAASAAATAASAAAAAALSAAAAASAQASMAVLLLLCLSLVPPPPPRPSPPPPPSPGELAFEAPPSLDSDWLRGDVASSGDCEGKGARPSAPPVPCAPAERVKRSDRTRGDGVTLLPLRGTASDRRRGEGLTLVFPGGAPSDRRSGEGVPLVFAGGAETLPTLDRGWGEGGAGAFSGRMFAGRPRRRREKARRAATA